MSVNDYRHGRVTPSLQSVDNALGPYYVSVRDGERVGLLAGPYATHEEALFYVDDVKAIANRVNAWAAFYGFGTTRMSPEYNKPGTLNDLLAELLTERAKTKPKVAKKRKSKRPRSKK